ncbi:ATP-dependent DNA helicase [Fusibacter paucivorans]|uniref:ATP-dependent DNA helicase n=1 Tax=Fusibacter paucivorans TaxID=76009 RepID=A0ABS5PPT7_9FIRM|nr:ATP-dependent DNA helicase [Fusibacter paucivorans]MBS7527189.1 ATP-dependent DNA helicase [Fusibacter paucivorans]
MYEQSVSVRNLVEFVYRSGSLDLRFQGKSKMVDGMKIHQMIQESQGGDYLPEVSLQHVHSFEDAESGETILLKIGGRADGILETAEGYTIDEIKGVSRDLETIDAETYPVHWAQAKYYGFMFAALNNLSEMTIQLTYANFESQEIKRIRKVCSFEELEAFHMTTVREFEKWVAMKHRWQKRRNASIESMAFPFPDYRRGQREMAVAVYQAIKREQVAFVEAPTGIGKTISTLFPAIKSLNESMTDKIFYLSAKAITKRVAEDTVSLLYTCGLELRQMTLTAKDKICFLDQATCYPEKCPYANGHFDRVNDALWEILNSAKHYTREAVETVAERYKVCPYEFSLDLAIHADVVVCDYNYAFDPRVYLRRFFDVPSESYLFLVDEAHNLVDRARTMFSATLSKEKVMSVKRIVGDRDRYLKKELDGVNRMFLEVRKKCDETGLYVDNDEIPEIYTQLRRRAVNIEKWLASGHAFEGYDLVLDLYFDILSYLRISELYDKGFLFYMVNGHRPSTMIRLFCINPATQLQRFIGNSRATVFFSATLSPIHYYRRLLTTIEAPQCYRLPSPFDQSKRLVLTAREVSVKYKDREQSLEQICQYVHVMAAAKAGNYMVFMPSYQYMDRIADAFVEAYDGIYDIIVQGRQMSEEDRNDYLQSFEIHRKGRANGEDVRTLIGFAVLGGIFSEGIDLKGDLLIGTAIIGVGLPMISFENNLIKAYFEADGYDFAYRFPGINKVMQGAGRVIRDHEDRGVILLMDTRFMQRQYTAILSDHWVQKTVHIDTIEDVLQSFWREEPDL